MLPVLCPQCRVTNRVDVERPGQPVCARCKARLEPRAPGYPLDADDSTFDALVTEAGLPVLVDFWANWCGPCHAIAPSIKALAAELAGRVRVVKVDFDRAQLMARQYGIESIPTLMVFRGSEAGRISGALPLEALRKFVDRYVGPPE